MTYSGFDTKIDADMHMTAQGLAKARLRAKTEEEKQEVVKRIERSARSFELLFAEMDALVTLAEYRIKKDWVHRVKRLWYAWKNRVRTKKNPDGSWKYRRVGQSDSSWNQDFRDGKIEVAEEDAFVEPKPYWEEE